MTDALRQALEASASPLDGSTDDAIALLFANRNQSRLCYVAPWGRWMVWDDMRWQPDRTVYVMDCVRQLCRGIDTGEKRLRSAQTIAAIERLARSDRRLAQVPEAFDADPWLLNTPAGIVDLRTGRLLPHDPAALMTKITGAAPGGTCPQWLRFLERVTGGDSAVIAYLQRVLGYMLTGLIIEHALVFLYGQGANGKSVLQTTITRLLGGYATAAAMDTFTATNHDRHPADLAALRGARLVTAAETEQGRRWDESRIKQLTGGDDITARFMRGDFFTFRPTFKILISGNHRPQLRSVDEAIRRRLHLVPFEIVIPATERDPGLAEKLISELGGIMRWAIEGCIAWQREGLAPPQTVAAATASYLETQDAFSAWSEDCCLRDPNKWEAPAELFNSWRAWAERAGEFVGASRVFGDRLEAAGFPRTKRNGQRMHTGIALRGGR